MGLISISSVEAGGGARGMNESLLTEVYIKDADADGKEAQGINAAAKSAS